MSAETTVTDNHTLAQRVSRALAEGTRNKLVFPLILLLGILANTPGLRCLYLLDDYLHASMLHGTFPGQRSAFDLYDFINDADRATMVARGMLPWWSDPQLKVRFFRPLASALIWAEHRALGDGPLLLHLHSLLWWIAVVVAARALFTRLLPARPALLATLIFAIAPCHALPVAWLANREALVSLAFGVFALDASLRFRDEGRLGHAALATVLFALANLAGEYSLCMGGYVLALAFARDHAPVLRRAAAALTFAIPAAAYLAVRASLGYGTARSGFYNDPFREPLVFLSWAPRRFATLFATAWLSLDGITLNSVSAWWLLAIVVIGGATLLRVAIMRAFAALDPAPRRAAEWLLAGSLVAMLPVLAAMPSPRLLGASMIGVAAVSALILEREWFALDLAARDPDPVPRRELAGLVALGLGFTQLVHAPMTAWLLGRHQMKDSERFIGSAADLRERIGDPSKAEVFVVRGAERAFFMPFALDPSYAPPARWRLLSHAAHVLALRRGPRTIDLVAPNGQALYPTGTGNLFRNERARIKAGSVFELPGLKVTVLEANAEGPRVVRFEAERDLDDVPWVAEEKGEFKNAEIPRVGFGKPFDP
jgi:hypothetical protein